MKTHKICAIVGLVLISNLYAIVGDWVSYGSQLTQKDLYIQGNYIKAVSHGGPILFDLDAEKFLDKVIQNDLAHIDIGSFYINEDGGEWYSYASGASGISYLKAGGGSEYFDLDFTQAGPFTGIDGHVFVIYKPELNPQIAHFVKYQQNYIYQDTYNQFPNDPSDIFDLEIVEDSLYLATDQGLIKAWIFNSNLKPQTAWESVSIDTGGIPVTLGDMNDTLYWSDENHNLYSRYHGSKEKLMTYNGESLDFYTKNYELYFSSKSNIYDLQEKSEIYQASSSISGFAFQGDTLWVAEVGRGLCRITEFGVNKLFIPNTMQELTANSLEIDENKKVYISGLEGVAILSENGWHNLVYSPSVEAIHDNLNTENYSADTLNISYHGGGGERLVFDALISTSGKLYSTVTHHRITPVNGQSSAAKGPGVLYEIDLSDFSNYEVYDTTNNMFEGTQGLGGSDSYLIMGGLAEDAYNNIYILNRHTLQAETLVRLSSTGQVRRFTEEESDNTLQVLAREMIVDKYGRLWIANQARQEDVPRTDGGITVYDPRNGIWALINSSDGLVSNDVYSLDIDPLTGNIWAATAAGVQMIYVPTNISSSTNFTMNPEISGLSNMVPVKIRIDPQGNKWILTQSSGIQIYMSNNRFYNDGAGLTTENSGLLDDVVFDVVFDTERGYAYLLTASGLSRFEIAWTEERETMDNVIVFPQPFKPGIDEYIAFDGLADQSHVRIATIDGRVVASFDAESAENLAKQVVWDGKLANGKYISRGVYIAFITNIDGLKVSVKFAVE